MTVPCAPPPRVPAPAPAVLILAWALVGTLAAAALFPAPAAARALALLIGVGSYHDAQITPLEGPPNDVAALREVLTTRWGFQPDAVRTLIDAQATRSAILDGLAALARDSRPGDLVLVYYSGHGTSPLDPRADGLPLPHGSGALTAWDSVLAPPQRVIPSLLVGRTDLRPRLETLDRGGRQVVVLLDACYSANATRGLYTTAPADLPMRLLPLPPQPGFDLGAYGTGRIVPPPPYPYARVLTLTAAAAGEPAADIGAAQLRRYPTLDRRPHGAFSNALLRVLHGDEPADTNGDGTIISPGSTNSPGARARTPSPWRSHRPTRARGPSITWTARSTWSCAPNARAGWSCSMSIHRAASPHSTRRARTRPSHSPPGPGSASPPTTAWWSPNRWGPTRSWPWSMPGARPSSTGSSPTWPRSRVRPRSRRTARCCARSSSRSRTSPGSRSRH